MAAARLAGAFRRFAGFAGTGKAGSQSALVAAAAADPTVIKAFIKANPEAFLPVFKAMNKADADIILKNLDAGTVTKLRKAVADSGDAALASKMFPDGATVRTVLAIGAGAGLIAYLDDKFEDEEEDFKNCMAGCVPHNWDEYEQGGVNASELTYSTPETLADYQITPIENQPYCVSPNENVKSIANQSVKKRLRRIFHC